MHTTKPTPHYLLIFCMFLICAILHYLDSLMPFIEGLDLKKYAIDRILIILPIVYTGFIFGIRIGIPAIFIGICIILPDAIFFETSRSDAIVEIFEIAIISGLIIIWYEGLQKVKEQHRQDILKLETAQEKLQSSLELIRASEKKLSAINNISFIVSQSLEPEEIMESVIDKVLEVMDMPIGLIFHLHEEESCITLATHRGVSQNFANQIKKLKLGEGFNGRVAQTGEPMTVENSSSDPRLAKEIVKEEKIGSQLIVPMKSKGKVVGTICIATREIRQFLPEEIDLLYAISGVIGGSVENSRLYQKEKKTALKLEKLKENLSYYLHQITRTQEEERKRIARELHDQTIQDLIALERQIDITVERTPGPYTEIFEEMRKKIDMILEDLRRFSQDLRPPMLDDLGLIPTIEWLSQDLLKSFNIITKIRIKGDERRYSSEIELLLFRITQEALRNVWKHSKASHVQIFIEFHPDKIELTIRDNGKGFKVPSPLTNFSTMEKFGLIGMQERVNLIGGNLKIISAPGMGTTVKVEILI